MDPNGDSDCENKWASFILKSDGKAKAENNLQLPKLIMGTTVGLQGKPEVKEQPFQTKTKRDRTINTLKTVYLYLLRHTENFMGAEKQIRNKMQVKVIWR